MAYLDADKISMSVLQKSGFGNEPIKIQQGTKCLMQVPNM